MSHGEVSQPVRTGGFVGSVSTINKWLAELAGWVVVVMMITISYDVVMRYAFGMPTTWSFELNGYMLIFVMFFSGAWALPAGGHVSVDIITERIALRKKAWLEVVTSIMAILYTFMFTYESILFTWDAWENMTRSTQYLAWPLWPTRLFLVIGGLALMFEFIFRLMNNVNILRAQSAE